MAYWLRNVKADGREIEEGRVFFFEK